MKTTKHFYNTKLLTSDEVDISFYQSQKYNFHRGGF